jgi:hypothetical protein
MMSTYGSCNVEKCLFNIDTALFAAASTNSQPSVSARSNPPCVKTLRSVICSQLCLTNMIGEWCGFPVIAVPAVPLLAPFSPVCGTSEYD